MKNIQKIMTVVFGMMCLLFSMILLLSCDKGKDPNPDTDPSDLPELVVTASSIDVDEGEEVTFEVKAEGKVVTADIYVGSEKINGTKHTFTQSGTYKVMAKKNDHLESNEITIDVYAIDVYVSGNGPEGALYWKNGILASLGEDVPTNALGITVDKGDVYIAGTALVNGTPSARYWKNGTAVSLSDKYSVAKSILVQGSDIYVVGFEVEDGVAVAKYWKNGMAVSLSDGIRHHEASSI